MNRDWDCVIVGGGAAGMSGALVLGRARRRTLLVDAGAQSNLPAQGIGGLLGHDGRSPADLYALGREELSAYPSVDVVRGDVVCGEQADDGSFVLRLGDGRVERARRVLLTTGMEYRPPSLPGVAELWGRSVFHCPFCHGWEMRDKPLGVLARGERAVHSSLLLRLWSDDVILLTDGPADLDDAQRERLTAAGVAVDERLVAELDSRAEVLEAVVFADGGRVPRKGLLVATTLRQRSPIAEQLGATSAEPTPLAQNPVEVDALYRTSAQGVFAAGDVVASMPQVATAVASGSAAAAAVVQSLMEEDFPVVVLEGSGHVNA